MKDAHKKYKNSKINFIPHLISKTIINLMNIIDSKRKRKRNIIETNLVVLTAQAWDS